MRVLTVLLTLISLTSGSVLDQFRANGIEFEVYGEGRLIPEKQSCVPYTLDLNEFVNSFNTNNMNEYSRGLLQKRIFTSFDAICRKFQIHVAEEESPVYNLTEDRSQMRYLDYFDYNWNSLRFERDLKSLFLENKINHPFLDTVSQETLKRAGASDVSDFSHKTTVFPKTCNVKQMTVDTMICFNISDIPQAGTIYALAHGGEFLHNEDVYAYYDIPQFALITPQAVIPIELEKCKVLFGSYIYCFEELDTQCDVRTLSDCPIYAFKSDGDFVFRRNFGIGAIYATTESEIDLYQNGTRQVVPGRVFVLRTSYGTENGATVMLAEMTPHPEPAQSQFAVLLPETQKILKADSPTRLYTTQRRGVNMLSHKHYDQGAWDAVRDFFGF
uniref:Recep_L_domain domain-containing protein n=1 Tax=Caenorhabditis tropicalis TaxID=1561998 RepID=A0A1I7V199_9PELO